MVHSNVENKRNEKNQNKNVGGKIRNDDDVVSLNY